MATATKPAPIVVQDAKDVNGPSASVPATPKTPRTPAATTTTWPASSSSSSTAAAAAALAPTHPLAAELASLRQQLAQYRSAAHQASIDVQGVRLELELSKEEAAGLRNTNGALQAEVDTLRSTPDPPVKPAPSNALAELSLAHRRLSAKLDFTEAQLAATALELSAAKQELHASHRAREKERAAALELERIEEDREDEIVWERNERRRIEEQKKLCDLALEEYKSLVKTLDPNAVPPPLPRRKPSDNILTTPPLLDGKTGESAVVDKPERKESKNWKEVKKGEALAQAQTEDEDVKEVDTPPAVTPGDDTASVAEAVAVVPVATYTIDDGEDEDEDDEIDQLSKPSDTSEAPAVNSASASADAISNLLLGQRGVHRLFKDFAAALSAKDSEIRKLHTQIDELQTEATVAKDQLTAETAVRVEAQVDRDRVLRDDASAAKVVERYMTFSQKAHATVHMHLGHLRQRSAATQKALRADAKVARQRLRGETERATRLRGAAEELASELGREAAGRRREVALRLQLIAADEARARKAESWLDKLRRAREAAEADGRGFIAPDAASSLLTEAAALLGPLEAAAEQEAPGSSRKGWRGRWLGGGRKASVSAGAAAVATPQDESVARVFLAEELVQHLVTDLQIETERRVDLERQRVAWLAKEAEDGVAPELDGETSGLLWDADGDEGAGEGTNTDEKEEDDETKKKTTPEDDTPSLPQLEELSGLFEPLEERYRPLQKSLHDQSISLAALRATAAETPSSTSPGGTPDSKRSTFRANLGLRPGRTAHDDLVALLDSLHEVIEDARVDTEIAVADEDRVFHGFAALLGVGASGVVQAASVIRDAHAYITTRVGPDAPHAKLTTRVNDIEHDLMAIKRTLHEAEGMAQEADDAGAPTPTPKKKERRSVWHQIELRTVTPSAQRPLHPSLAPAPALASDDVDDDDDDSFTTARPGGAAATAAAGTRSILSSVGRTFSSGVAGAASGVAAAPRQVGDLAGGLFRPLGRARAKSRADETQPLTAAATKNDDDVE
ncbi:uncharacterized protein LOC62_02G002998 [Vanrija pseudolonga]|uniref:Uncharacterized protein n=1 Tax=Vanrija pseudolonga TaxID=143232 RepID=A0AAF0Y7R9_9TREE|nr:hypothetical protein LOC62_02G002998 [Vanrija pseudolonga]